MMFVIVVSLVGRKIFELEFVMRFLEFLLEMHDLVSIQEAKQDGLLTLVTYLPSAYLHKRSLLDPFN